MNERQLTITAARREAFRTGQPAYVHKFVAKIQRGPNKGKPGRRAVYQLSPNETETYNGGTVTKVFAFDPNGNREENSMEKSKLVYRVTMPGNENIITGTPLDVCRELQKKSEWYGGEWAAWCNSVAGIVGGRFPSKVSQKKQAEWLFGKFLLNGLLNEVKEEEQ